MNLEKYYGRKISISDVVHFVELFINENMDRFAKFPYLYISPDEDNNVIHLNTVCYFGGSPKIINGKELLPDFVRQNGLEVLCSGDVLTDVYDDLDERYPKFTKEQFVEALNYFMDNDDYIDFWEENVDGR